MDDESDDEAVEAGPLLAEESSDRKGILSKAQVK